MSRQQREPETAEIVDTLMDGRGVARPPGKTVFVDGALTGETVRFVRRRRKRSFDEAELLEVLEPSPRRVEPRCAVFGVCGGCSLQHLDMAAQLSMKQAALLDNLQRIGSVQPQRILEPIGGAPWGYRRKARLAVKHVTKKGRVLVGFRERNKPYVTNMSRCETLHPELGERLEDLAALIDGLSIRDRVPQIEAAVGDDGIAMVFRVLDPPSGADLEALRGFGGRHGIQVLLQPKGPDSIAALPGEEARPLSYSIPGFGISIEFTPVDFIQVHAEVNGKMIGQAIELLAPDPTMRVLDLFSGLGNFSLPIATLAREVVGVELASEMVARAAANAARNGIENVVFRRADLSEPAAADAPEWRDFDLVMLDPPRTGAFELLDVLGRIGAPRIVYVSCHPGTLARDAGHLVKELGYQLEAAGAMDMFPQTGHVESMALFRRA
ncbi:MAG: 23S rRNA (uracil(1939)-C(5))-methyltransferase RlmD [Gammaproteobacteria bacterium]|nr:23S rRNA (uracil(1939)-C(5))-methyltransferase RlmD [Gammaproteobacteria bacterium]NND37196.1 23S rRNA (uracil(1939)-C(5))-methyltransferase RlmD [Gammaproteobacteria bacterium]